MTILKLKKNKIRAMKCIDEKNDYRACDHLWIGTLFGNDLVPYGKEECEDYD